MMKSIVVGSLLVLAMGSQVSVAGSQTAQELNGFLGNDTLVKNPAAGASGTVSDSLGKPDANAPVSGERGRLATPRPGAGDINLLK